MVSWSDRYFFPLTNGPGSGPWYRVSGVRRVIPPIKS